MEEGTASSLSADEQLDEATKPGATLAETVATMRSDAGRQARILAGAIYFPKSESLQGQLAVGHVIANRANSGRFRPDLLRGGLPALISSASSRN